MGPEHFGSTVRCTIAMKITEFKPPYGRAMRAGAFLRVFGM